MAVPQVTDYTGIIPIRTQPQDEFNTNTASLLTWWPTSVPEMNEVADFVNEKADEASIAATSANNVYDAVVSAANFVGEWDDLTGSYSSTITVFHDGTYWRLLVNVANIASTEPSLTNDDWALAPQSAGRVVIQSPFTLTLSGRYYILGSDTITIPDPASFSDGMAFDFAKQPGNTPLIQTTSNGITSRQGSDSEMLMDSDKSVEMIVNNSLYEV